MPMPFDELPAQNGVRTAELEYKVVSPRPQKRTVQLRNRDVDGEDINHAVLQVQPIQSAEEGRCIGRIAPLRSLADRHIDVVEKNDARPFKVKQLVGFTLAATRLKHGHGHVSPS